MLLLTLPKLMWHHIVGIPGVLFPTQNVSLGPKSQIHSKIGRIRFHQQHKKFETLNSNDL